MSNSKFGEILKIGLILFAITAVCAMLLAVINNITKPIIEKNQKEKTYASMQIVMPDASSFEAVAIEDDAVLESFVALDKNEKKIGVCIITKANGYGGAVKVLTGISDGKVTGIDILSHSETPGLGARAAEPGFLSQFCDKTQNITVEKGSASANSINAISGATITSRAVTSAVNAALKLSEEVDKQ